MCNGGRTRLVVCVHMHGCGMPDCEGGHAHVHEHAARGEKVLYAAVGKGRLGLLEGKITGLPCCDLNGVACAGVQLPGAEQQQNFAALEARVHQDQKMYLVRMEELYMKPMEWYNQYDERAQAFVEVRPSPTASRGVQGGDHFYLRAFGSLTASPSHCL